MASGLQIDRQPESAGSGNLPSYSTEVLDTVNVRQCGAGTPAREKREIF
jgi:hypothetical protein